MATGREPAWLPGGEQLTVENGVDTGKGRSGGIHVLHGTWIPDDEGQFVQGGAFYLWVETDGAEGVARGGKGDHTHSQSLPGPALEAFLKDAVGLRDPASGALMERWFTLPTADDGPLPSLEMSRYLGQDLPEECALGAWRVTCYRVGDHLKALKDLHYLAQSASAELIVGADLLYWYHYAQAFKGVIARDRYIPALVYRELPPEGKKKKGRPEVLPSWEIVSADYQSDMAAYAAAMPLACAAGWPTEPPSASIHGREGLLRHFAENTLRGVVAVSGFTAKIDDAVVGSLVYRCLHPLTPVAELAGGPLEEYRQWRGWRDKIAQAHTAASFTLCLQLLDAPSDDPDGWQVRFLVAARDDPSLRLPLEDYWGLRGAAKKSMVARYGVHFERDLLLALGYAARIYPKIWEGMATAQPVGFRLTLEEAFAFLAESAWVLEDAGYTVIVPAWWTPQGRRKAKVRLRTQGGRKAAGSAATKGYFSLDAVVQYDYELAIGGQTVSEAEWATLVAAKTPLVHFRGEWMQLDRERMAQMLEFWRTRGREEEHPLTVAEVLRMMADGDEVEVAHDDALADMLALLHDKSRLQPIADPPGLHGTLRDYQRRGVAWLQYLESLGLNPCLADDMGLGKCVSADTLIPVNGTLRRADEIWQAHAGEARYDGEGYWAAPTAHLLIHCLDADTNKMTVAPIRRLYRQRVHETLRQITLEDGSSISITRRHKLLTSKGWTNEFAVRDYVCVHAALPWTGPPADPDLVTLLAWQIAEGHEQLKRATVSITQKDERVLCDLQAILVRLGERYGFVVNHPRIASSGDRVACLVVNSRAYCRFLESKGYVWGKLSREKVIPDLIMHADLDSVRLFLRHYFDAEGAAIVGMRSVEISSASPLLMQQLGVLLRRFGIWLRVSAKQKRATTGSGLYRTYGIGTIGGNGARVFLREIGFGNPDKRRRLEEICVHDSNTNVEGIPASGLFAQALSATKLPVRHFGAPNSVYSNGSQEFSRASLRKVVAGFDRILSGAAERDYRAQKTSRWTGQTLGVYAQLDRQGLSATRERLRHLLDQEVFYCRIKSIEDVDYDGWVYDLEVAKHHNFVANNILCHNTVQVIAQLVNDKEAMDADDGGPTLLIAPTSVLGNWRKEVERFAPHLRVLVHHGAGRIKGEAAFAGRSRQHDVVVTSYPLARMDEKLLRAVQWRRIVVDEAQNIKNPQAAQTRAILKLSAPRRLALTGTPVENRLLDLWSIFNFLNPGYLGKEAQFRKLFETPIQKESDPIASAMLKKLVEPFILRRLKTDKQVIADLPDKVEQKVYCNLTREQASLYEAVVRDVDAALEQAEEGMARRGLILATLTRLKQICNHPAQFLGDGSAFSPERSHKLARLLEMVDEVLSEGESMLIFTQYTEIGAALESYFKHTLHYTTHYLHGGTSRERRERMIAQFQDDQSEPSVFILSLRAGGVGITLTRANHVFHFDRWWNPAVEDQATDRAFRIGQRKNVFVHKFVALGTLEERIDAMIEDKKKLAGAIVGSDESWLTELDNETFKGLIALNREAILE